MVGSKDKNSEIVKNIFEFAENKIIDEQNKMHKEIEDYLILNIAEMENEAILLTESYEDDISKFNDGKIFSLNLDVFYENIILKLKEEMINEVKKLNNRFEDVRNIEIEKIKLKYLR